jgi:gas vesicle protein
MEPKKSKHSAREWVKMAKEFGDECIAIQRDSKLSPTQKWEKQQALSNQLVKEIKEDSHLTESEKRKMKDSIKDYMDDWKELNEFNEQNADLIAANPKKPPKKKKTS